MSDEKDLNKGKLKDNNNEVEDEYEKDLEDEITDNIEDVEPDQEEFFNIIKKLKDLDDIGNYFSTLHKGLIRLRMILLISETKDSNEIINEFNSNFIVSKSNDLYKIEARLEEGSTKPSITSFLGYLWLLPKSSSFIMFTFTTKKNLMRYLFTSFINKSKLISPLWVTQDMTIKLINHLRSNYNASLKKWKGEYSPLNNNKSKIRPFIEREIYYSGNDAYDSLNELNDLYGVNVEAFTATLFDLGFFSFNRKFATFVLRQGKLETFISISNWLFENSDTYMKEVRKFKKELYYSIFSNRSLKISNDLSIDFYQKLSNEILNEIVKRIKSSTDLRLQFAIDFDESANIIYNLKIFNLNSKGSFKVIISKNSAHVFQIFNANFISAIPFLDIIDFCQPKNEIFVQVQ